MSARRSIARALRKWADLIDPRTDPHSLLTLKLSCDTSEFMAGTDAAMARIAELEAAADRVAVRVSRLH